MNPLVLLLLVWYCFVCEFCSLRTLFPMTKKESEMEQSTSSSSNASLTMPAKARSATVVGSRSSLTFASPSIQSTDSLDISPRSAHQHRRTPKNSIQPLLSPPPSE